MFPLPTWCWRPGCEAGLPRRGTGLQAVTVPESRLACALAAALLVLGFGLGCAGRLLGRRRGRPTVVVTTNILGDITRNVVGDRPRWWC